MKYLFILSFALVFAFFGLELGYTTHSAWHTHITYMFQHANLFHLVLNSMSFVVLWIALQKHLKQWLILPVFLIAVIASFLPFVAFSEPTVGISGAIYAMLGVFIVYMPKNKNIILFLITLLIALGVSLVMHNSNFFIHLYCLVLGSMYGLGIKLIK